MAKKQPTVERPAGMMAAYDLLKKEYGNDSVFNGSDPMIVDCDVISTGSYSLDEAIGLWGVPRGRITQFAGATAGGKTFMCMQVVKQWQSMSPNNWAYWVDAEFSFTPSWAKKLGLDMNRIDFMKENDGAKIFDRFCGVPPKDPTKGKKKPGILDTLLTIPDHGCGVIVVDSIASIVPPVEAAYGVGHQNMAPLPRFLGGALRRIQPYLERLNIALIFVNQIRTNPGAMFGNPEISPGGNGLKHAETLMVNFAKSNSKEKMILNANEDPIGHTVMARIDKNRLGFPGRKTDVRIKYLEGVTDRNLEVLELGIGYDLIKRPNNRTYIYKDHKWTSADDAAQGLMDLEIQNQVINEVKELKANGFQYGTVEAPTATSSDDAEAQGE